jgi:hypothetical protein
MPGARMAFAARPARVLDYRVSTARRASAGPGLRGKAAHKPALSFPQESLTVFAGSLGF